MKTKLKANCSIVRIVRLFDCGRVVRCAIMAALCAVGLSAFAAPDAVQLWENGPYFATCNIGAEKPEDYGILTNFNDAAQAVTNALGADWHLPTAEEFTNLLNNCEKSWETCKDSTGADRAGYRFTGKGDYSTKSIFLPAAGVGNGNDRKWAGDEGNYWSSTEEDASSAWYLYFYDGSATVGNNIRSDYMSVRAVRDTPPPEPPLVAQFVQGGVVTAEFATADEAVAALDDAQYADIEEFRIGLAADTEFDFGGRTNRVVIGNVGAGTNTLKNVFLDGTDNAVTGSVGWVVFGDGVRIEKEALGFKQGLVELIIKGGLYKNEPIGYCEGGYLSARRYDENEHLNGLYAVLPAAEIAVEDRKGAASTRYATLQDAFNLIGKDTEVTLRLFNNLKLGKAVAKLEGNKTIRLLPGEADTNTITRVGTEPVIEIGRGAKLEISNVVFDGANFTSEKPMIEVAGNTAANFGWLIAGDGFVVSNAVGGAVHVGNGGKFELNGVAKIIDNTTTGGKPKNVIIEDSKAILLTASGAVTNGNYAQIGVSSDTDKIMIPGGQFGEVNLSYEYAKYFSDGDISVAKPWVGFINDRDGTLHHAAGAKIAAAPKAGEGNKTYKRWVGGEYKVTLEEGDYLISREKSMVSERPELIWTARQDAPAEKPAPAVLDWTDTTLTLAVSNGCDYALVMSGSAETNWVSMVKTDNTYAFARPAGTDYLCLRRYSITPSNIVSAATAYSVRVAAGTKDDPWTVGEGIAAWTNGTEFVIGGTGTVPDLAKLASKVTVDALTIKDVTVTGAESEAFKGFSNVSLTLPDGWQGELPKDGAWYGATGVKLAKWPLSVKNVTSRQRYPWNGLVDIGCDLTGAGEVTLNATVLTNGVKFIEAQTLVGETTVDLGEGGVTNGVKFIWNAAADLPAGFKADGVQVKVTVEKAPPPPAGQLWANGPIWEDANFGESEDKDHSEYGALYKFDGATNAVAQLTDGRRLPTKDELQALIDNCDSAWNDAKKGYTFTGKGVYSSNSIFLPAAGYEFVGSGGRFNAGDKGIYWSATPDSREADRAYSLDISKDGGVEVIDGDFGCGSSVRLVKDAAK